MPFDYWSLKEVQPNNSEERWFYRKNLTPAISPKDNRFRYVACVTLGYEPRDSSGLPNGKDEAAFFELEGQLLPGFGLKEGLVRLGAVLKGGMRDLVFYIEKPESPKAVVQALEMNRPSFPLQWETVEDPSWEHYEGLPWRWEMILSNCSIRVTALRAAAVCRTVV